MSKHHHALSTLCQLNAHSLWAMEQGRYSEARSILQQALEQLAHRIQSPCEDNEVSPSQRYFRVSSVELSLPSNLQTREQERPILLYSHAFSIPYVPSSKAEKAISLMAVLYNCGLACQLESLSTHDSTISKRLQTQTAKMYESVLELAFLHFKGDLDCVMLATTNNLAHLYAEQVNTQEAATCVGIMMNMMVVPFLQQQLSEDDEEFFQINVIAFTSSPIFAVAPAA